MCNSASHGVVGALPRLCWAPPREVNIIVGLGERIKREWLIEPKTGYLLTELEVHRFPVAPDTVQHPGLGPGTAHGVRTQLTGAPVWREENIRTTISEPHPTSHSATKNKNLAIRETYRVSLFLYFYVFVSCGPPN